jgi:hypothetical protein
MGQARTSARTLNAISPAHTPRFAHTPLISGIYLDSARSFVSIALSIRKHDGSAESLPGHADRSAVAYQGAGTELLYELIRYIISERKYASATDAEKLVFVTNRICCAKLLAVFEIFPQAGLLRSQHFLDRGFYRTPGPQRYLRTFRRIRFEFDSALYTRLNRIAASEGMVRSAPDAPKKDFLTSMDRACCSWNMRLWHIRRVKPRNISRMPTFEAPRSFI